MKKYKFFLLVIFFLFFLSSQSFAKDKKPKDIFFLSNNNNYAVIVDKEVQKLYLYLYENNSYKVIKEFKCSTGKIKGEKQNEGDMKTPEGVYFVVKQYLDKDLSAIYGSQALVLDYPNFLDRYYKKSGSSIWIHGTNKALKDRDSSGCVALKNKDVDEISKWINIEKTPIIITKKISFDSANANKDKITKFIEKWLNAHNLFYKDYISFYTKNYAPNIFWWNYWVDTRNRIKDLGFKADLIAKDIIVCKQDDTYVAFFEQFLKLNKKLFYAGKRKVFIIDNKEKGFEILNDVYLESFRDGKNFYLSTFFK